MEFLILTDGLSSSPWAYALVLAFAAFDALVPLFPSETAAIAAGVLAAAGDLEVGLVMAAAGAGAFLGDASSYLLGRTVGPPAADRLLHGARWHARLAWARRILDRHGSYLIVIARFVPGGRTAATLTAGLTRMRWPRFVRAAALAAGLWATFAVGLGYVGGRAFEQPWRGLAAALAVAASLTLGVETARRARNRLRAGVPACCGCPTG